MTSAFPQDQVAVFSVPHRVVLVKRLSEISLGLYGLVTIAVFFPWHAPRVPDSIAHIVWPVLAVGVAVPMAFVWFRWNRIPKGAAGGRLTIGPDGVDYRVGTDRVQLGWAQIAAVYPVTRAPDPRIRALWLPRAEAEPPGSSRRTLLEIAHLKAPYRPVLREDGVVLPLTLFGPGRDTAEEITLTLRRHLEAKGHKA